jgi:hypothetical protein
MYFESYHYFHWSIMFTLFLVGLIKLFGYLQNDLYYFYCLNEQGAYYYTYHNSLAYSFKAELETL